MQAGYLITPFQDKSRGEKPQWFAELWDLLAGNQAHLTGYHESKWQAVAECREALKKLPNNSSVVVGADEECLFDAIQQR